MSNPRADLDPTPGRPTFNRRGFIARTGGVAALAAAGFTTADLLKGPGPAASAAPGLVADPADQDALALLKRMLTFDTQNSGTGGKTREHAEMLKAVWTSAGVPAEIIPTPQPDNVHLIARIKGTTSAAPLLFLGHSDVVPVELKNWSVDPFSATVKDGQVYGRGALDMKGANAASISALLRHVGEGGKFDRDIIVLTDCDEEAGSYGSGWLTKNHWDKVDAGMVLTEGGWFLAQGDKRTAMMITATRQDKVYFNLDLTASGLATHSSKPNPQAAIVTLSRAVAELGDWLAPVTLTAVTRDYFESLARATTDLAWSRAIKLMLTARSDADRERAARVVVSRSTYPWLHSALLRTTAAFVIEDAGYKENVIPSSAHVRVNCRAIPGGQKPREFLATVREMMASRGVDVALAARPTEAELPENERLDALDLIWATPPADIDTPLFHAISQASVQTYPEAVFTPALFEAGTSLAPWRAKGIPGYGVYPYVIDNDQLIAMHGNDERIYVDALKQGSEFMYRLFSRFRA